MFIHQIFKIQHNRKHLTRLSESNLLCSSNKNLLKKIKRHFTSNAYDSYSILIRIICSALQAQNFKRRHLLVQAYP